MVPSSQPPADIPEATVYLWNCITKLRIDEDEKRKKRERENGTKEKEGEERSGFSRGMEIDRGKCIEKASGREHINAIVNYLRGACKRACTSDTDITSAAPSCVPESGEITYSSLNDRDSLLSRGLIDPPGFAPVPPS